MSRITETPINLNLFFSQAPDASCGAVTSFVGIVRNHDHGKKVRKLYYECYKTMAEKILESIISDAKQKWPINEVRVIHRIGGLEIGEVAVAIAVSSSHREESFLACRFLIESIKSKIPIWKKEIFADGEGQWVSCHASLAV